MILFLEFKNYLYRFEAFYIHDWIYIMAWVFLSTGVLSQSFHYHLVFLGLSQIRQEMKITIFFCQAVIWTEWAWEKEILKIRDIPFSRVGHDSVIEEDCSFALGVFSIKGSCQT